MGVVSWIAPVKPTSALDLHRDSLLSKLNWRHLAQDVSCIHSDQAQSLATRRRHKHSKGLDSAVELYLLGLTLAPTRQKIR